MKKLLLLYSLLLSILSLQAERRFTLSSPNGNLSCSVFLGDTLSYSILFKGSQVLSKSSLYMTLDNGETVGIYPKLRSCKRKSVDRIVESPFYRSSEISDKYNELVFNLKKEWSVEFRAYDDGIAYRFVNGNDKGFKILDEHVEYILSGDEKVIVPYVARGSDGDFESQFFNSFENTYTECNVSAINPGRLIFLPMMYETSNGIKVCITESDLENYPGLYLRGNSNCSLKGIYAPCPKRVEQGGHNRLQMLVREREDFIASIDGKRSFPWRIAVVSDDACNIAASNLSYLLASPSRLSDVSWVKPGKVAWDWWNDWNPAELDIDLSFIEDVDNKSVEMFIDGINFHRIARDYRKSMLGRFGKSSIKVKLAPGGGFVMKIFNK